MAALAELLQPQAPLLAAPAPLEDYVQFKGCAVPDGSGAVRAYRGFIRPFSEDEAACQVLRAIESGANLQVSGGRLNVDANYLRSHPLECFLTEMAVPFRVLILEYENTPHPIAFLIGPRMLPRFNQPIHIRADKSILIGGELYPALCVYSGTLFRYEGDRSRLEQFLDQTSTYLAKYLIWLRTRMLFRPAEYGGREFVYRRKPNEAVTVFDLVHSSDVYWDGYWPGPSAPSGATQHLATIKRTDECWCWSGKNYGECCRPKDLANSESNRV